MPAVGPGSTITGLQNLAVNAGTITATNGASLGTSTDLDNRGTITLGPGGTLTVGGTFTQEAAGTLDIRLGGPPAGGSFGRLQVAGAAALGGVLAAELVGGYAPAAGDAFPVVTAAGASGAFAAVALPAMASAAFGATVNGGNVVLTAGASSAAPATTAVTSSLPTGATYGQSVTFTAVVAAPAGTPTGAVQFQLDGANFGTPVALAGGTARLTTTPAVGPHTVGAVYLSDSPAFADSDNLTAPLTQAVDPGAPAGPAGAELYYTQFGAAGSVGRVALNYDGGTSLAFGTPALIASVPNADGLMFLPNGNLILGTDTVATQVDPATGPSSARSPSPGPSTWPSTRAARRPGPAPSRAAWWKSPWPRSAPRSPTRSGPAGRTGGSRSRLR